MRVGTGVAINGAEKCVKAAIINYDCQVVLERTFIAIITYLVNKMRVGNGLG